MLKISKELFTAWNEANLLYCHWKSNEHLLAGLEGETDLDVLLSCNNKEAGEEVLRRLDFLQCKSQFGSRYPDVDDWIGFDKDTGRLIHVHLHYGLVTGHKGMKEYSLLWTDKALCTRVLNVEYGIYTIEPNLEMVTLFTRIGLKADFRSIIRCRIGKFQFPKDVKKEIDWLKCRVDMKKIRLLLDSYYGDNADVMFELIKKDVLKSTDYLRLRKITESTFNKCSRVKSFMRIREVSFFAYQRFGKRIIQKIRPVISKKTPVSGNGISIAFIGQDGSGKSTVTNEIKKWLTWKIEAERFYLGSGDHYNGYMKRLLRFSRQHIHINEQNNSKEKKAKEALNSVPYQKNKGLRRKIALVMTSVNFKNAAHHAYKTIQISSQYVKRGGIALFDRFPQNQFKGIYDGPKIINDANNGLIRFVIRRLSNQEKMYIDRIQNYQPTLVFKLQLPPEESIRRKPHENLEAVSRKAEITKALRFDKSHVVILDATQDYKEEILKVKRVIWSHLIDLQ